MTLKTVTARLPEETLEEVEAVAARERIDRSELIRRLLDWSWFQVVGGGLQEGFGGGVAYRRCRVAACLCLWSNRMLKNELGYSRRDLRLVHAAIHGG